MVSLFLHLDLEKKFTSHPKTNKSLGKISQHETGKHAESWPGARGVDAGIEHWCKEVSRTEADQNVSSPLAAFRSPESEHRAMESQT